MNYEKKYKEALDRASKLRVQNPFDTVGQMMEYVFPELKESEDEKIRKELIKVVSKFKEEVWKELTDIHQSTIIAWLEKQGKSIDEEKVLIGARKDVAYSIISFLEEERFHMFLPSEYTDVESAVINSDWKKVYGYMQEILEKQGEPKSIEVKDSSSIDPHFYKPDEVRTTGYWNVQEVEQKPAWSEDDEEMLKSIIATCKLAEQDRDSSPARHLFEMQDNWLKSLKDRYTWKPSDEQMKVLFKYAEQNNYDGSVLTSLYQDLKKLKVE